MKEVKAVKEENQIFVDRLNELWFKVKFCSFNNPYGIQSKRKLAREFMHITEQSLNAIFKGETKLSAEHAKNIAEAFPGVDPAWLLGVDEETLKNKEKEENKRLFDLLVKQQTLETDLLQYCGFSLQACGKQKDGVACEYVITKIQTGEQKIIYPNQLGKLFIKTIEILKPLYDFAFSVLPAEKSRTQKRNKN